MVPPASLFEQNAAELTTRSAAAAGWKLCDGSAINRTTYAALFGVIGTTYGAGNGTTLGDPLNFDKPGTVGLRPLVFNFASVAGTVLTNSGEQISDVFTIDVSQFTYSDGSKQRRVWHLTRQADGRYTGRADDVLGEAQGRAAGNALRWQYTLKLPVDGKTYEVQFDDWMYLMDDKVMLNKAVMSKFGIRLGEVTLAFHKP